MLGRGDRVPSARWRSRQKSTSLASLCSRMMSDSDVGEAVVVDGGGDKGRSGGEERNIESPEVLEGWANRKDGVETDERVVGVGPP